MDSNIELDRLLKFTKDYKGSDLFLTVGLPPTIKVFEKLIPISETVLTEGKIIDLLFGLLTEEQKADYLKTKEMNFAIQRADLGRFRVSLFQQRLQTGAVLRRIQTEIPTLEELNLPPLLGDLVMTKKGLILIVGPTGVGKSSTLAAMIGHRNEHSAGHIITIEDPIEFVHEHRKSIITQREIGIDTQTFASALKYTLRQAPDVILIGEIRNSDTMEHCLAFSETGHLCLSTLHASNAHQALDRMASFYPKEARDQLWLDLSINLKAIIAQRLIPMKEGEGKIPAIEILINTPLIADYIRKGKIDSIKEIMTRGGELGMQTFEQSLFKLYIENKITEEEALKFADSENELRLMIKLKTGKIKGSKNLSILDENLPPPAT